MENVCKVFVLDAQGFEPRPVGWSYRVVLRPAVAAELGEFLCLLLLWIFVGEDFSLVYVHKPAFGVDLDGISLTDSVEPVNQEVKMNLVPVRHSPDGVHVLFVDEEIP